MVVNVSLPRFCVIQNLRNINKKITIKTFFLIFVKKIEEMQVGYRKVKPGYHMSGTLDPQFSFF
jgi:hypothetical protein